MKKVSSPTLAIAAVFPAAMVPIMLLALQHASVSDFIKGIVVGVLLGTSLLLIMLANKTRPA